MPSSASSAHEKVHGEAFPEKSVVRRAFGQRDAVPPVVYPTIHVIRIYKYSYLFGKCAVLRSERVVFIMRPVESGMVIVVAARRELPPE